MHSHTAPPPLASVFLPRHSVRISPVKTTRHQNQYHHHYLPLLPPIPPPLHILCPPTGPMRRFLLSRAMQKYDRLTNKILDRAEYYTYGFYKQATLEPCQTSVLFLFLYSGWLVPLVNCLVWGLCDVLHHLLLVPFISSFPPPRPASSVVN